MCSCARWRRPRCSGRRGVRAEPRAAGAWGSEREEVGGEGVPCQGGGSVAALADGGKYEDRQRDEVEDEPDGAVQVVPAGDEDLPRLLSGEVPASACLNAHDVLQRTVHGVHLLRMPRLKPSQAKPLNCSRSVNFLLAGRGEGSSCVVVSDAALNGARGSIQVIFTLVHLSSFTFLSANT